MIIHLPQITNDGDKTVIRSRIEFENGTFPFPKTLWYSFPRGYRQYMPLRGDAFLVGLITTAMALGENIEINAPVSPKLVVGLKEYQKILKVWFPTQIHQVQISPSDLEAFSRENNRGDSASFFTGGVDSSFTLRANLIPQQPVEDFRIKQAIFVHGADIPLNHHDRLDALTGLFTLSLKKLDVNLIPCATNVRSFTEGLFKWVYCHGAALISAGLVLQGLLKRLYISASYDYRNLIPWGSSPLLDHWLSTESIDIVHYGASYHRKDKMKLVGSWEPAHEYLNVCSVSDHIESVNCERCAKCLGTKAIFDMDGTLSAFKSFRRPFGYRDYLRWAWICRHNSTVPRYTFQKAVRERHWKKLPVALLVGISWLIRYWFYKLIPDGLRIRLRNRFLPLEENPFYAPNITEP
jgi:hypothetical protein